MDDRPLERVNVLDLIDEDMSDPQMLFQGRQEEPQPDEEAPVGEGVVLPAAGEIGPMFLPELIGATLGGAIPGVTQFTLDLMSLLTFPAMAGAQAAYKHGQNEVGGALTEAAKTGLLGAIFQTMHPLNQYLRTPAMGGVFAAQAAAEGGDAREIAKSFGTGALFSLATPGGRYGLKEVAENARSYMERDIKKANEFQAANTFSLRITATTPEEFIAARDKSKYPQFLTPYSPNELQGFRLFKVEGKDAGYALKPDGDLVNVFNASGGRGTGDKLVRDAIDKGAVKLDCYDGWLAREFYPKFGFEEIRRESWSEAYKPESWLDKHGTPDIIYMRLQKGSKYAGYEGKSGRAFESGEPSGRTARDSGTPQGHGRFDQRSWGGVDYAEPPSPPSRVGVLRGELLEEPATDKASSFAPQKDFRRSPLEENEPAEFTAPISRSEIKDFLEEKLDIPIRTGRFRVPALGIFKPRDEVIRTKHANDIETISHEIGHALQKFLWPETLSKKGLSSQPFAPYAEELVPIATVPRTGQDVAPEGFAEFIRLYVTNPKEAEAKAPRFHDYFDSLLQEKSPESREILLEARRRYDLYMKQPALQRILSQISIGVKEAKSISFDDLYTKWVDDLHPIEMIVKEMAGDAKIDISKDPYRLARLLRGSPGKAEAFLKNKPFRFGDYADIPGSKSLKEILGPVRANLDEFRAYMVAKRALGLSGRDIETGILKEDARKVVNDYDAKFSAAFEDLKQFQDHSLDYLQDSGILDAKAATKMRAANQDYIPFFRVMDGQKNRGIGSGLTARNPVKGIRGSWRDIIDPLESVIKNTFLYINLAEKNAVGRALIDLAKSREGLGKYVERVPTEMRPVTVSPEEIARALKDLGEKIGFEGDLPAEAFEAFTVFRPNAFTPKDDTINVWIKGKPVPYQVHPELARAFKALDKESMHTLFKLLSYPASWLRAGATLTPEFIARNPVRDQWSAYINSKYGYVPGFDLIRGIFHILKKDDLYWEFKKSGADHSMLVSMDRDYLQDNLGEILQGYPLKNVIRNPIEGLRMLSELTEMGSRIGEFERGIAKEGTTKEGKQAAAYAARELTLDFSRSGSAVRGALNAITAFSNAQIQDFNKISRQFQEDPLGTSIRIAASITLPSVLLAAYNTQDPRWKEIPQWQKDLFWIVMTPSNIWRIPKPFTMGIVFGSMPERAIDYVLAKDPHAFDGFLGSVGRAFSFNALPTALIPLGENWFNESLFFGRPIVPRGREGLLPEYRYGELTSETAKQLGALVGRLPVIGETGAASPAYIENLVRGWTGGLGKYALDIASFGLETTGIAGKDYRPPAKTWADIPFIKGFAVRYPSAGAESIERFYQNYEKAQQVSATVSHLAEKEQNPEKAARLLREGGIEDLSGIAHALGYMRDIVGMIYRNPEMKPDEKRELIDTIYLQMIETAKRGNAIHDEIEKARRLEPIF